MRSRPLRAFTGLLAAWLLMASGAGWAFGPGVGLLVAGALLAAYIVTLYDVDDPVPDDGPRYRSDLPEPVLRLASLNDGEEGM